MYVRRRTSYPARLKQALKLQVVADFGTQSKKGTADHNAGIDD